MYKTRAEAQADADKMLGWDNVRVVVEPGVSREIPEIIYIRAEEPSTGRPVIFDSPHEPQARYV